MSGDMSINGQDKCDEYLHIGRQQILARLGVDQVLGLRYGHTATVPQHRLWGGHSFVYCVRV